jgi:hypothetical protein
MKRKVLVVHGRIGDPAWTGLLRGYGWSVESVELGTRAISAANAFAPDAILWDASLEIAESAHLIRTLGWVHWIPILVLVDAAHAEFAAPLDALPFVRLQRTPVDARVVLASLRDARRLEAPTSA